MIPWILQSLCGRDYFIAFCFTEIFTVGSPLESFTNKKTKANIPISFPGWIKIHWLQGQLKLKRYIPHDSLHLFLSLHKKKLYKNIEPEPFEILRIFPKLTFYFGTCLSVWKICKIQSSNLCTRWVRHIFSFSKGTNYTVKQLFLFFLLFVCFIDVKGIEFPRTKFLSIIRKKHE